MSNVTDLWGQDISLDESGQARVVANGELVLTQGVETGVQDIKFRLFPPGVLCGRNRTAPELFTVM